MGKRGPKPGTGGRPKKALYDNIIEDNPGKRPLMVLSEDINQEDTTDYTPPKFLNEKGKEIFEQTVEWLKGTGCLGFINPQHISEYAHCKSRWLECEQWNDKNLLAKHPTTGNAIASPYVSMLQQFTKQANQSWYQIYQIVRENASVEYKGATPQDDVMERLLRARKGQ